ncbi:MAG TPA: hypothetical protein VK165_02320, partial [Azonexus sp.]|nr:hypothetical protein [Azonexus sp.]
AAAGLAGAAVAGWQIGGWLNDNLINPGIQKLTGDKNASLGTWIYDKLHPQDSAPARSNLVGANQVKASGEIKVSFQGAPAGMRVEQTRGGDVPINTDVGYRSFALGMP